MVRKKKHLKNFFIFTFVLEFLIGLPNIPTERLSFNLSGHVLTQPYYRNTDLDSVSSSVRYAVVSIHGDGRNADEHYNIISSMASSIGILDSTIVIAPLFLRQEDIIQYNLDSTVLYWPDADWNAGDLSRDTQVNPRPSRISSFSSIDTIYHRLVDNNPNLEKVILTGHSAGSQMVVRYAAGGRAAKNILENHDIDFVYVSTNTPSFLYLDDNRVVDENSSPFEFGQSDCYNANYYKYGLYNLNNYMEETGSQNIIDQHLGNPVTYLVGQYDYSGGTNNCARMTQGSNILMRSHVFFSYLGYFYGDTVYNFHKLAQIPNVSHDFNSIIDTDCGIHALFGTGECELYLNGPDQFNFFPVSNAGTDQNVFTGDLVFLDGSQSTDQDGTIESFLWRQVEGEAVVLFDSTQINCSFIAPLQTTEIKISLTVVDNEGLGGKDTTSIFVVENQSPVSMAGQDQSVVPGAIVILDGSQSNDLDGSISTYLWQQISGNIDVDLFSFDQAIATFYAPEQSAELEFALTVTDSLGLSGTDTVQVRVVSLSTNSQVFKNNEEIITITPNPFNGQTKINFKTIKKGNNKIFLFDIRGKRLRTWRLNGLTSGSVRWDGKDQYGLDLMSGLYFVAFQTPGKTQIKKITYLK